MNLTGKVIANRYELLEEIGSGGMAYVYKAKCQLLNRFVAVKILRPELQNDLEFVRRFNVEAQAAASLAHPNIVSIYDVGTENDLHYIVMEYVEGETLKEYIDKKHLIPWREAVDYAIQIAKGLEQAHKNSIIHRDIKPHNIIMTPDGVMKVTDFGIARANVQTTMTCDDCAIGSVHYISPEQARGGYTDERSDMYSLGIVLYEMLTGTVPFDSDRPVTIAIKHIQEAPKSPREHNISIPLTLEKIVLKMISKEVSSRHKSVSEVIADLQGVLDDPLRALNVEKTDENDLGQTIKMPVIKSEDAEISEKETEKEVMTKKKKPTSRVSDVDKKKERRVIIVAIVCALLIIGLISFAFLSITGIGSLVKQNENVEIPEVVGMLYEDAVKEYKDAKFSFVKNEYIESDKEKGTILSQEPEAGSKVKGGEEIVIMVDLSEGSSRISLKNYTRYKDSREVELEIKELDLKAEFIDEFSDEFPIGSIIRQEPTAGTSVRKGDKITFYVSKGPENEDGKNETQTNNENDNTNVSKPPQKPSNNNTDSGKTEQKPPAEKKSAMLTIYGPRNKDSALVQVKVNGTIQHSVNLAKNKSDVVKLESTADEVTVEILYDGVSQQKRTIKLH